MASLLRLTYASRARFDDVNGSAGIHPEVARILIQSRRNNPRRGLVGALYFGDGCFFQCLEGPAAEVEALYQRLHDDPRHHDLKVLARDVVARPSFSGWAMKLVPNASEVRRLMARHGRASFDPYSFDAALLAETTRLLLEGPDAKLAAEVVTPPPGAPEPGLGLRFTLAAVAVLLLGVVATVAVAR
ncbi:MAG TPA: BLUF domain-containing protein [Arenimonas sp.]|uniref:BLUF domain-containing protein n=1 Tax=Arenimonas sp. TaxID=1872635 RepID=UPI002D7F51DA|nr:BLUF domain-containing protein [Arenimonas sp.]HEU0152586.1 BLUF domain-containing protein [Arenimonas sp.]